MSDAGDEIEEADEGRGAWPARAFRRLLCRLELHRPAPGETWNRGYFFTYCSVCDANLVRTASGKWHVPTGFKVVWRKRKPRGKKPAPPTPAEAAPPGGRIRRGKGDKN